MNKKKVLQSQISESEVSDEDSDESVEQRYLPRVDRQLYKQPDLTQVVINTAFTKYPVIREVSLKLRLKIIDDPFATKWDLCWTDHPITARTFIRMHFHQMINYLPGIHTIARKNQLGVRLNTMKQNLPKQYSFYPSTWMLPEEFSSLRKHIEAMHRSQTYIVKPEADCQGRGIFLMNRLEDIRKGKRCVVQKYMDNPLLIDGYKFDLRIYVLIGSLDPLRIYIYHDGLARFATESYQAAQKQNYRSTYQHLTNYAINKRNPKFKEAQSGTQGEVGFKRSLKAVMATLAEQGIDCDQLWKKIEEIAVKTLILGYQKMRNNYINSQPEQYHNRMAFHVLGLDILIDDKYEPFLLEVNHTPSFATETPLDHRIKFQLVKDTLTLMKCHDVLLKQELFSKSKVSTRDRVVNGVRQTLELGVRAPQVEEEMRKREQYEKDNMGGYSLIYPNNQENTHKKYSCLISKVKKYLEDTKVKPTKPLVQATSTGRSSKLQMKQKHPKKTKQRQKTSIIQKKKIDLSMMRRNSLYSDRMKPEVFNPNTLLVDFIRTDIEAIKQKMSHSSITGNSNKPHRTFTIKTRVSMPRMGRRVSIEATCKHRQAIKDNAGLCPSPKDGNFVKPKIYDVSSLVVTNPHHDESKVIRKKNKEGKYVFHLGMN